MREDKYRHAPTAAGFLIGVNVQRPHFSADECWVRAMNDAVALAIGAQCAWTEFDIKGFDFDKDKAYALAIALHNMSFIRAYERDRNMRPFWGNRVRPSNHRGYLHMIGERRRERLAVGFVVAFGSRAVGIEYGIVTSLTPERVIITVHEYDSAGQKKVKRLIKLDHEACAKMFPAKKTEVV